MKILISKFKFLQFINLYSYAILIGLFFIIFYPVWFGLINAWMESDDYSHGFFIIPISIYIVWQKREKLKSAPISGSKVGLLITIFSFCLYIISTFGMIITLQSFSMLIFIGGSVLYLFGYKVFIELLFPIFMLCFMIPAPSQILSALTINLQLFVSAVSSNIMPIFGIPVFREGNLIHLPEKTLQVVAACSGMRSLNALLALSAVFGYFTLRSNILRIILFISGVPVAIFVNIIRISLMIIFISYWGIDLSDEVIHKYFGLFIFLIALAGLYSIRWGLGKWDRQSEDG